jgi:hypothetical protein
LIKHQKGKDLAVACKQNMMEITNREILDIFWYFDSINISEALNNLRVLSTEALLEDPNAIELAESYRQYIDFVISGIHNTIEACNQMFSLLHPLFFTPNEAEENESTPEEIEKVANTEESCHQDLQVKRYIVEKLKEINYLYYKELSVDEYGEFINTNPQGLTDAALEQHWEKYRNDIKKIIIDSPKLGQYLASHRDIFRELDIIIW